MKYREAMKRISWLTRISMVIGRVHRLISIHACPVICVYKRVIGRTQFFHRRLIIAIARRGRVIVRRLTEQHVHPRRARQKIGHAFSDPSHKGLKTKTKTKIFNNTMWTRVSIAAATETMWLHGAQTGGKKHKERRTQRRRDHGLQTVRLRETVPCREHGNLASVTRTTRSTVWRPFYLRSICRTASWWFSFSPVPSTPDQNTERERARSLRSCTRQCHYRTRTLVLYSTAISPLLLLFFFSVLKLSLTGNALCRQA